MSVCRPSLPPASWIITSTRSFWTPADLAERTARARKSGTAAYPEASAWAPTPKTRPLRRKSLRVRPFVPPICFISIHLASVLRKSWESFQLEFRRREENQPAGRVVRARAEQLGGRGAQHPVKMQQVRVLKRRDPRHPGERRLREVDAGQHVVARDPARVRGPAADLRRVEERLAHTVARHRDRTRERGRLERLRHVHHELDRALHQRAIGRGREEFLAREDVPHERPQVVPRPAEAVREPFDVRRIRLVGDELAEDFRDDERRYRVLGEDLVEHGLRIPLTRFAEELDLADVRALPLENAGVREVGLEVLRDLAALLLPVLDEVAVPRPGHSVGPAAVRL